eukprot:4932333-Amphidinium_carterae.1
MAIWVKPTENRVQKFIPANTTWRMCMQRARQIAISEGWQQQWRSASFACSVSQVFNSSCAILGCQKMTLISLSQPGRYLDLEHMLRSLFARFWYGLNKVRSRLQLMRTTCFEFCKVGEHDSSKHDAREEAWHGNPCKSEKLITAIRMIRIKH